MPHLTPNQAQWMWLGVFVGITAIVIALDVWMALSNGLSTTLSHCHHRASCFYWSITLTFVFWIGYYCGHIGTPCQ